MCALLLKSCTVLQYSACYTAPSSRRPSGNPQAISVQMSVYDFSARSIEGREQSLSDWRGQALLIVNVASRCGFTPQYTGLQALHQRFHERGFAVLGFPCDQFGHQEPGDEAEIRNFCSTQYEVTFPLFAKIDVNGANAHPPVWLSA